MWQIYMWTQGHTSCAWCIESIVIQVDGGLAYEEVRIEQEVYSHWFPIELMGMESWILLQSKCVICHWHQRQLDMATVADYKFQPWSLYWALVLFSP